MRTSISNDSLTVSVCHFGSGNWQMRKDLVTLDKIYTKVRKYLTLNWISKQIHKKWNNIVILFFKRAKTRYKFNKSWSDFSRKFEIIERGNSKLLHKYNYKMFCLEITSKTIKLFNIKAITFENTFLDILSVSDSLTRSWLRTLLL